jgi:hypothetical protein
LSPLRLEACKGSIRLGSSGRSLTKTRPMCTAQSFNESIQSNSILLYT